MPETSDPFPHDVLDDRFAALADAELDSVFEMALCDGATPADYEELISGFSEAFGNLAGDTDKLLGRPRPR